MGVGYSQSTDPQGTTETFSGGSSYRSTRSRLPQEVIAITVSARAQRVR